MLNENYWAISFEWFNSSITYSTKKKLIFWSLLFQNEHDIPFCMQAALSNVYVVARMLQSKNISGPRLRFNLAWLSSSLVKFIFYNAILICLSSTFILNVKDTAIARLWDSPSRKLITSFTITAGWDWAVHDQVKLFTKINHFSKEKLLFYVSKALLYWMW